MVVDQCVKGSPALTGSAVKDETLLGGRMSWTWGKTTARKSNTATTPYNQRLKQNMRK
jgi:hypothetical protein